MTNHPRKEPHVHWAGVLICALGAVYYSYEYFLRIAPSVMEHALRAHFSLGATGFGFLSAFYYYAYVPLQLPVGVLIDRFGPRILMTLACFLCVVGTYLFTDTRLFWVAAMGRFLVGFGSAFAFVGVLKLATIWLPENRLAMVAGLTSALGTIGAMLGDNFIGLFVDHIGWVATMNGAALFGICLTMFLWLGLREKETSYTKTHHSLADHGTIHSFKRSVIDLWIIAKSRQIWINGLYGCLVYLPTTVFGELWGIPYLTHAHHLTHQAAGFATSLMFLGFMLGAPLMGLLSDLMARRKPPMLGGALGACVVMSVILYVPHLSVVQLDSLMFLLGVLYSAQCIVFAVGRESSPDEAAGTAIAMTNMLVMLGAMFLQPFVGRLLDISASMHQNSPITPPTTVEVLTNLYTASDYQLALSIIPIGILIAAFLVLFIRETYADIRS